MKGAHLEETAKAKQSLEAFRNKVKSGRLVKFYKNPDDLKAGVLQALVNAFRLKPGRGWVRSENASRLEDLKEINELRKRLGVLEAENTSLKIAAADPRTLLAQGSELASWTVQWVSTGTGSLVSHNFVASFTWDELLAGCFDIQHFPTVHPSDIAKGIQALIRMKAEQAVSSNILPFGSLNQDGVGLREMINEIKQQFLGLGYIDIEDRERIGWWVLTPEGRVRVALLRGKTRMPD